MRVLSLFAGIGGIDLGLHANGCETVAYSEVDQYASRVMELRFPEAVNLGDITLIEWEGVSERFGDIDIICGGFPCQDISLAGKGEGISGARSGLWKHYADSIRILRPRGVLVENVAALTSRGIDRVLGDLAACGYDAEWDCIPAASVGAPHLRDRVFIVAYRSDSSGRACQHSGSCSDSCCGRGQGDELRARRDEPGRSRSQGNIAADADDERREECDSTTEPVGSQLSAVSGSCNSDGWRKPVGSDWWCIEPELGRMAHGVSNRMDRLRCLGNAVVPQVADHVAGILMDRVRKDG